MSKVVSSPGIHLPKIHWGQMRAHVAEQAPLEACGLVAGVEGHSRKVYVMENELASPVRFRIPGASQIEALQDMEDHQTGLLAIYHSHPAGPPAPSATDIAEAAYPDALHLIWSPGEEGWQCRAFRIQQDGYVPLVLKIAG